MENLENTTPTQDALLDNREIHSYLLETAKWGNFLAIIGYVFMGLLALLALFMIFGMSQLLEGKGFPMWIMGLVYLALAGVYWFPVTYLYRFSAQMKQAVKSRDESLYTSGFANLKSLFKFFGIFTIVMLALYGLILVIAVPMAMFFK
jgi:hypothetical protein